MKPTILRIENKIVNCQLLWYNYWHCSERVYRWHSG